MSGSHAQRFSLESTFASRTPQNGWPGQTSPNTEIADFLKVQRLKALIVKCVRPADCMYTRERSPQHASMPRTRAGIELTVLNLPLSSTPTTQNSATTSLSSGSPVFRVRRGDRAGREDEKDKDDVVKTPLWEMSVILMARSGKSGYAK